MFDSLISKSGLKKLAGERYFERGVNYFEGGAVVGLRLGTDGIAARVQGTEPCPYTVRFWVEKRRLQWGCACPLGVEGAFCKHLVATGLAWLAGDFTDYEPDIPEDFREIEEFLQGVGKDTLVETLSPRLAWDEGLFAEIVLAARAARHEGTAKPLARPDVGSGKRMRNGVPKARK
ncbi:MAG: SWIM zinc finger family protein [Betaproteobacteria bacterium]